MALDRLLAMQVFTKVVELGSFTQAAQRLSLSASAVSRHVADLEAYLGTRLLHRTTRRLSLTESGQAYFARVTEVLSELEETEAEVSNSNVVARGTIRLTCSTSFGVPHLAPAIAAFQLRYPDVKFHISTSGRYVDLVEEGLDLAIRIGDVGNPNLIARRIGEMQMMACASPDYLSKHGTPKHPKDLAAHNCVTYAHSSPPDQWRFSTGEAGDAAAELVVDVGGGIHADSGEMLTAIVASGAGIVLSPSFVVEPYLASGQLREVLKRYRTTPYKIYAMYPSRRYLSAKVRVFVDFLAERFAAGNPSGKRRV